MKRNLVIISTLLLGALYTSTANAQQLDLAPNQNPRYQESQDRYLMVADSLTSQQGTTVQDTYKAYDWYEAKIERRAQRRSWRHEERMNNSYYSDFYPSLSFGSSYYPYGGYYGNYYGGRSNFWLGW